MKNEGIQKASEQFREKIELAHKSNHRSHDILKAIREFLKDIGTNIENKEDTPINAQKEILESVDQLIEKTKSNEY